MIPTNQKSYRFLDVNIKDNQTSDLPLSFQKSRENSYYSKKYNSGSDLIFYLKTDRVDLRPHKCTSTSITIKKSEANVVEKQLKKGIPLEFSFTVMLAALIIFTFTKNKTVSSISDIFKNHFQKTSKNDKTLTFNYPTGFYIFHSIVFSLSLQYFFYFNNLFSRTSSFVFSFFIILISFQVLVLLKIAISQVVLGIFKLSDLTKLFFRNNNYSNLILSIALFVTTLFTYSSKINNTLFLNIFIVLLFVVVSVIKIFRNFLIFQEKDISFLFSILYFCTLEIIPLIILFKLGIDLNYKELKITLAF
jgi:hypothetical protein